MTKCRLHQHITSPHRDWCSQQSNTALVMAKVQLKDVGQIPHNKNNTHRQSLS